METDPDRSYVIFHLNPAARFSDGTPVTAEDVVFSWKLLRDKGRPNYRTYYSKVSKAEIIGEGAIRFDLSGSDDRELPLILDLCRCSPSTQLTRTGSRKPHFDRCSAADRMS